MAGDWIKFECSTPDKPEVFEIAGGLDLDPDAVVGKLLRVWNWFDQHTETGNAPVTVVALLNRITGVSGFCAAMEKAGWLVRDGDRVILPHFERHNGKTAKNRALTARRVAKHKKSNADGNASGNAGGNDGVTKNALPREEKRREEYSTPIVPKGTGGVVADSVNLDPLHCRIIRCITPNSKCDKPRDEAEMRAWRKVRARVAEADVALVEKFYRLSKSRECDATWKRKSGVTQLLNQWTEQVELASSVRSGTSRREGGPSRFESV